MKYFIFFPLLVFTKFAFAHGDIKLIECYSPHGKEVLRAMPSRKGVYHFKVYKNAVLKSEFKGVKIKMTDTMVGQQLVENLDFKLGDSPVKIKILETPLRKVREGSAALKLKNFSGNGLCSAIY